MKGFAVFLVIALLLGFALWNEQNQNPIVTPQNPHVNPMKETRWIRANPTPQEIENFDKKLQQEVSLISQIDEDPQLTEERLKEFSKNLKDTEIKALYESSLDLEKPQDERFLAVTLLSWSQKSEVGELLEQIALAETDPFLSTGRNADFEAVLRMKAVEGLGELPLSPHEHQNHLQNIVRKSSSALISDRAQRSLWALAGEADRPEKQDEKALSKLLEKSVQ